MAKRIEDSGKVAPLFKSDDIDPERTRDEQDQENANRSFSDLGPDFIFKQFSDKEGHNIVHTLRIPPWISAQLSTVIESKISPYKSSSEFFRDAIYHRMMYWAEKLKDI